jgi:cephalosporin-C deacetylase
LALFDMPLDELRGYRPERTEPDDFDQFWAATLAATRERAAAPTFQRIDTGLSTVDTFDVTFSGFGGDPVKAWLHLPAGANGPLPCVVEYVGYGGGRGLPPEWLLWSAAGYAHLIMDTRGQGSGWRSGDTADREPGGGNPQVPGFMTRGILDPEAYYYRRVFADAVRAVETARAHPAIDSARIAVAGGSQGGGISLAVAALVPDLLAVMPDVPFLCHYRRATEITDSLPYGEIARYCRIHRHHEARVFATLGYFDGVNFAARCRAPALFSVGLMDLVCPPSTVFAAYNHYAGPAELRVWPYNEHEGGQGFQEAEQLRYLRALLDQT